jgi:hypothetical protein
MTNLGNTNGNVGIGDVVIAGQEYSEVTNVSASPPGDHSPAPIRSDYSLIIVECANGHKRYLGAIQAYIGADLRMHWSR